MEIVLITNKSNTGQTFFNVCWALMWKAWQESRGRFFSALILLVALVFYGVFTSRGYLTRYNFRHPEETLSYSVYIWSGLFYYTLQGLWILSAFVLGFGGLARERATGAALFTLGLPVRRLHLFVVRAVMASTEAILLAVISALLIPALSGIVGESYPLLQALMFGLLTGIAGLVFLTFGLLLSELFEAEFTAPVIGLCMISAIFFGYKGHAIHGRSIFDVMSGAAVIHPHTQMLNGSVPWFGLFTCVLISLGILYASIVVLCTRDF